MKTMYTHDGLERIQAATDHLLLRSKDGWVIGQFFDNQLSSIFQPVFEANELRVVGHAAYIPSESEHKTVIPPWGIFTLASEDSLLVKLDRLCRTVHAINYFNVASGNGNLFLNVQPRLLESVRDDHGQAFKGILDLIGIATSRVVIEIPVEVNRDWRLLKHVIGNYRSRGYQVAVNHDGGRENWMAGLSDLRPLQPDIVRLEASALLQHNGADTIAETVHRLGAALLVRKIETTQQLHTARITGADLFQGDLLGEAARTIEGPYGIP
jgi:EAL domain-containing protein (putative c-di-GMP-specific phosphodiesterase class I)